MAKGRLSTRKIMRGPRKGQRIVVRSYRNGNFAPVRTKSGGFKRARR